ncbi:hypothetical protein KL930_005140 [Ogataea haglerorum]|uniref:Uncharacterized protein n=1 Tax=Ogataea haglerorum TaxID=1937702 RepID=A0AAN6HZ31_9ASCO|nr:uncharacterized protein KL911_005151 [Ogataea haglerorum]KAG7692202.1 hypothetical protein KL951_005111 [Ogataea haglerorum]KAG7702711.1 hypothetical protein KL914_005098 [Ogataea haglerorum]KAG7702803.1 hypothetical protein KL950_005072 [Ogataea haglerorum]KAG7713395.1 hypothetical protein KL913_005016 [Ogataea haglerorum]KAG7713891.1 hypothetical protein KL949_005054 [Ogataea haglerorum]
MLIASNTITHAKHFASVLLSLKPVERQRVLLHRHLVDLNNALRARFNDLRNGYFDYVAIPFDIEKQPIRPYDLPYGALIRGRDEKMLQNRLIEPQMLNLKTKWPNLFYNDFLYSNLSTYHVHVSLTPIVMYESDESIVHYKREYQKRSKQLRDSGKYSPVPINLDGKVKMFTRVDYQRFFLALPLDEPTVKLIEPICDAFCDIRFSQDDIGYVNGEVPGSPTWKIDGLHVTLGMNALPQPPTNNFPFGMYELSYLNNVLLKPKEELLKTFPDRLGLDLISDVKLELTREELQELQFESSRLVCSLDRGELWEDL